MLHKIDIDQKEIVFMRVPGHVGIRGNETALRPAKEALDKEHTDDLIPFSDLKPLIAEYINQIWQKIWMKLSWCTISFMRFYRSFRTNCYYFVRQRQIQF